MTGQQTPELYTSSEGDAPRPGWRIAYYIVSFIGGFTMIVINLGLWIGYRKDAILSRVHRTATILAAVSGALVIGTVLAVSAAANHAVNANNASTDQSSTSTSQPANTYTLPTESIADSPEQVVAYMENIRVQAFETGDTTYLDHYYLYSDSTGYIKSAANINGGARITHYAITNINNVAVKAAGDFTVEFERQFDEYAPQHVFSHYVFTDGEWRLHDAH